MNPGSQFELGFEIEVVFMRRGRQGESKYEPLESDGHESSSTRAIDHPAFSVLEEATIFLEEEGVHIEIIHPKAASGQYETVQSKPPALEAMDTLVYVRKVLATIAAEKGYKGDTPSQINILNEMEEEEKRMWLMARY